MSSTPMKTHYGRPTAKAAADLCRRVSGKLALYAGALEAAHADGRGKSPFIRGMAERLVEALKFLDDGDIR